MWHRRPYYLSEKQLLSRRTRYQSAYAETCKEETPGYSVSSWRHGLVQAQQEIRCRHMSLQRHWPPENEAETGFGNSKHLTTPQARRSPNRRTLDYPSTMA